MNIGIIGSGAIAQFLLDRINNKNAIDAKIKSIFVRNEKKYHFLTKQYGIELYTDLEQFLSSNIDIVVEAANVDAVKQLIPDVIKKKDAVIISIGALADNTFFSNIYSLIQTHNKIVHLPSGAIGGLDLLQNAHVLNEVTSVTLTTRKPAHTLTNEQLVEAKTIFSDNALNAIAKFPENINVSIILSLAGIGVEQTTVKIIADPHIINNIHSIQINGAFGEATITVKNNPLKENPSTSYLAALSVLGTLAKLDNTIKIGH